MKVYILIVLLLIAGCAKAVDVPETQVVLEFYNWEEYIGESTIESFEQEYGITVHEYNFEDEDFMIEDVQANIGKYDLVVASDYAIQQMSALKLLEHINKNKIPNLDNIGERFRNRPYDPDNDYSIPYLWGTTGIVINTKYVEPTTSWGVLWDERYAGKIAMLNNKDEVIAAGLKYLGYSINPTTEQQLEEAHAALLQQKELGVSYEDTINIRNKLIAGNIWAAHEYSGEGVYAVAENPDLKYIIPEEGASLWIDNFAIPKNAKNAEAAHLFINFVLREDISAAIANELYYANTNEAAMKLTDEEILLDPALYPPPSVMERLELFDAEQPFESMKNKIWAELNAK